MVAHGGLALGDGLVHADLGQIVGGDGVLDEVRVDVRGARLDVREQRLRPLMEDARLSETGLGRCALAPK